VAVSITNNVLSFSPRTTFSLVPNSNNFVSYDVVANLLRLNTSGFPNQVIPIATVTASEKRVTAIMDNRPDWVIIPLSVGLVYAPGIPLVSGNFSFSGWGTGASLNVNSGTQTGFSVTVTAGSAPSIHPTITLTFTVGYSNPPMSLARVTGGTGMFADITVANTLTQSVLTYEGLPVSGKTYTLSVFNLGQ
jgi:hypothetical protein